MGCTSIMKVPYDANKENKSQTVAQDLKITTFHILMLLNTAYEPGLCDWAYKRSRATYRKEKGIVSRWSVSS